MEHFCISTMLRCCCARTSPSTTTTTNEVHPGQGCGFRNAADNVITAVAALFLEPSPVSSPPANPNINKPAAEEETSHGDDVIINIPDPTDDDDNNQHPTGQGEAGPNYMTRCISY